MWAVMLKLSSLLISEKRDLVLGVLKGQYLSDTFSEILKSCKTILGECRGIRGKYAKIEEDLKPDAIDLTTFEKSISSVLVSYMEYPTSYK